jgi:hypothetical protein
LTAACTIAEGPPVSPSFSPIWNGHAPVRRIGAPLAAPTGLGPLPAARRRPKPRHVRTCPLPFPAAMTFKDRLSPSSPPFCSLTHPRFCLQVKHATASYASPHCILSKPDHRSTAEATEIEVTATARFGEPRLRALFCHFPCASPLPSFAPCCRADATHQRPPEESTDEGTPSPTAVSACSPLPHRTVSLQSSPPCPVPPHFLPGDLREDGTVVEPPYRR